MASQRIKFLNTWIDNIELNDLFTTLDNYITLDNSGYMVSLNLNSCVKLEDDKNFADAFNAAELILMDSQPLMNYANRRGLEIKEKISGSDLMPRVCEYAAQKGYSCFILGGNEGIPEQAAKHLVENYPGLIITGTYSPEYGFENDPKMVKQVIDKVAGSQSDILFVCLGMPKAEILLFNHLKEMNVHFAFSVGAAVDFIAGNVKRAPIWMQKAGLEWFYRFLQEPKRLFRRYFIDSWQLISVIRKYS